MKTFNSMIPVYANCVRDGVMDSETPVRNLVRGDIVEVKAGDIVPADIRIIESKGFKVCFVKYLNNNLSFKTHRFHFLEYRYTVYL